MTEEADDPLDRLLHAEEVREFGIDLDRPVHEDTAEPGILARVDHHRLADRPQHALGGARIVRRVVGAFAQILLKREFDLSPVFVQPGIEPENPFIEFHLSPQPMPRAQPILFASHYQRTTKSDECFAGIV